MAKENNLVYNNFYWSDGDSLTLELSSGIKFVKSKTWQNKYNYWTILDDGEQINVCLDIGRTHKHIHIIEMGKFVSNMLIVVVTNVDNGTENVATIESSDRLLSLYNIDKLVRVRYYDGKFSEVSRILRLEDPTCCEAYVISKRLTIPGNKQYYVVDFHQMFNLTVDEPEIRTEYFINDYANNVWKGSLKNLTNFYDYDDK